MSVPYLHPTRNYWLRLTNMQMTLAIVRMVSLVVSVEMIWWTNRWIWVHKHLIGRYVRLNSTTKPLSCHQMLLDYLMITEQILLNQRIQGLILNLQMLTVWLIWYSKLVKSLSHRVRCVQMSRWLLKAFKCWTSNSKMWWTSLLLKSIWTWRDKSQY